MPGPDDMMGLARERSGVVAYDPTVYAALTEVEKERLKARIRELEPALITGYNTRPSWDDYFLHIADAISTRADCRKRKVGAVIVKDNRIVSSGYNGSPAGAPGCLDGHCPRGLLEPGDPLATDNYETGPGMCISIHAEQNAIIYGDYTRMKGGTMYITTAPCRRCSILAEGAGIHRIVYPGVDGDTFSVGLGNARA